MSDLLRVKVVCRDLPGIRFGNSDGKVYDPVYLGIQHGRVVVDQVRGDAREAIFEPEFKVGKRPDGTPNFLGPFAQGTPDDRFFYLSWGVRGAPATFEMFRRLKVRLGHLKWREIQSSLRSGKPLVVHLRLTDKAGGPLCATPGADHIRWEPV